MQTVIPEVTTEVLQAFANAWNDHDVDALMSFMIRDGKIFLKNSYRKNRQPAFCNR